MDKKNWRPENKKRILEISWIPGHTDREKEAEKKKRATEQMKELYDRFEVGKGEKKLKRQHPGR
jgi:hypothetical protein